MKLTNIMPTEKYIHIVKMTEPENNYARKKSIQSLLRPLKTNHIFDFLIVLDDFNYINCWCWFWNRSNYDTINMQKSKFPGNLNLVHLSELTDEYIIDGPVQIKTLYLKMPKENIYVDSHKYQEKIFNSKFNELISIFSELNAKRINFYFHNMDQYSLDFSSKLKIKEIHSVGKETAISESYMQKIQKKMCIVFDRRPDLTVHIEKFADSSKYHYLPKEFEWMDVIRNRVNGNMKNQTYSFTFSDNYKFKSRFYDSLKSLEIDFGYQTERFNELRVEYEVEYYSEFIQLPMSGFTLKLPEFVNSFLG